MDFHDEDGQRELCGTIFSENIETLRVSCHNWNYDWVAWALFFKHPCAECEWLRQNHRFARALTSSFVLSPRVLHKRHRRSCRNSNSREISPCCNSVGGHQIAIFFAHTTTAQLSCYVQNLVAITALESRWNEIPIELNCDGKTVSETTSCHLIYNCEKYWLCHLTDVNPHFTTPRCYTIS